MSASLWDWPLTSADGLPLTNDDCFLLLDAEFSDDLLKSFPNSATKLESVQEYQVQETEDEASTSMYPPSPPDTKPTRAQLASDLLYQLDHHYKQENIFSNWFEEKADLPVFEGVGRVPEPASAPAPVQLHTYPSAAPPPPPPTEELLREFETVYGAVELTHLTPPQSPPGPASQLLLSYAHLAQAAPVAAPPPVASLAPVAALAPLAPLATLAPLAPVWQPELALNVEELLAPPASSPSSSPPSSPSSPASTPSSTDDEWVASAPRSKPYARSSDDRRSRKKEQNKNAATRYRQKKKAEVEVLLGEEHALRQRHGELGAQRADLQREVRYLKGLMRELFKAKGLIK